LSAQTAQQHRKHEKIFHPQPFSAGSMEGLNITYRNSKSSPIGFGD